MKDIRKFPKSKLKQLAETPMDELQMHFPEYKRDDLRFLRRQQIAKVPPASPDELARFDIKERKLKDDKRGLDKRYKSLQEQFQKVQRENDALLSLSKAQDSFIIKPLTGNTGGEATCVVVASDWHVEERVSPEAVNNMNEYSVTTARERAEKFFQVALHLRNLEAKNTPVPTMVLALLGDFITGHLHEENFTTCSLEPVEAAYEALGIIQSGIDFLLRESDLNLIIPCHAGNHGRITLKYRSSETELGNSLEYFIYGFLAKHYKDNSRVKFLVSKSYISKLQIYGTTIRFHHGHRIRFQGGVGGLTIPTAKYVARSNVAWKADYDVFGHHHQKQFGPNFICNGSMIGYNAYAQDNGFPYEEPSQTYFLINKRWKDIIDYRPILFS